MQPQILGFLGLSAAVVVSAMPLGLGRRATETGMYAQAHVTSVVNNIDATFDFNGYTDGTGTFVTVKVLKGLFGGAGLGQGPYGYHIHTNPIGPTGNCSDALGHLDPFGLTDSLICDPAFPQFCQEGDLSGKHGKLNGTTSGVISAYAYTDDYLRFFPEDLSILGRSIVIHSANKTRLACGNIISTLDGTAATWGNSTGMPSKFVTRYPTSAPTNPLQTSNIFVGETLPTADQIRAMPFPLGNPAPSIREAYAVSYSVVNSTVFVNNTQLVVWLGSARPVTNGTSPFTLPV